MRRYRVRPTVALGAILWLAPAFGWTQNAGSVAIRQFQPSPFADHELRLDGSAVLPAWKLHVGVDVELVSCSVGGDGAAYTLASIVSAQSLRMPK